MAQRTLFERCAVKLHAKKPLVRLNLLRILRSICEAHEEQGSLMRQYGLLESVQDLAASDPAILVREMAKSLLECVDPRPPVASRGYPGVRRSSSSTMTPPPPLPSGHSASSMPPTPVDRAGSHSGFFDFGMDVPKRSARPVAPSSRYRPASRDAKSGSSASSAKYITAATSLAHPPLPTTTTTSIKSPAARLLPARSSVSSLRPTAPQSSRSSLAPSSSRLNMHMSVNDNGTDKASSPAAEYHTPTHVPPSANTRGSSMAAAAGDAHARRRRQTSGAELMRHS